MIEPSRPKKKPPIGREPIETSDGEFSSAHSLLSSPCPSAIDKDKDTEMEEIVELSLRQGKKRKYPQSPPKKGKRNQELEMRVIRHRASIPSSPPSFSPEQHLQRALESLNQAYIGLEREESKEQIK